MRISRGFSLIEMVIVIIVLGIIAAAAAPVAVTSLTAYNNVQDDLVTLDKVRYATERLARELREVAYDPATTTYNFTTISSTAPVFTKSDGVTVTLTNTASGCVQPTCYVRMGYSTPLLSPAPILTDQVGSLSFSYYNQSGTLLTSLTWTTGNVKYVEVLLTLQGGSQTYSERTRVQLRNQ